MRIAATVDLPGLDNLIGVSVLGYQALTQRDIQPGDLRIAFTAETQLSDEYCRHNNLHRDATLNADPNEVGYLEQNRRIRAIKLRGHRSDALLMPLESLAFAGVSPSDLNEGDAFDTVNGHEICRKYEIPVKASAAAAKSRIEKAFKRVDTKLFPEHLETLQYWREKHLIRAGREVVVSQKLHGTSVRIGRVPCLRQKGYIERFINRWISSDYEFELVIGSRTVIKHPC